MTKKKQEMADEQNQLREFFDSIRDENEGKITKGKLETVAKELGYSFTDAELEDMIGVADPAGEGAVTYKGLAKMVHTSQHDFPRLKTTIEEIRRELTSLSISAQEQESEKDKTHDVASTSISSTNEPTPSTSRTDSVESNTKEPSRESFNDMYDEDENDDIFETDNAVIIGEVMKASENDNRKQTVTLKGKGKSTKGKRALVVPVSGVDEDDLRTVKDDESISNNDLDNEHLKEQVTDDMNAEKAVATTPRHTHANNTDNVTIRETTSKDDNIIKDGHDNLKENSGNTDGRSLNIPEDAMVTQSDNPDEHQRDTQSRQSAATRFSLDAGVVTAVDKYHSGRHTNRIRRRLETLPGEEDVEEEDELQTVHETENVADENETPRDRKNYIRDKTRRIRRKASLTHSQQSVEEPRKPAVSKPAVRKRSLSKGRVPKAKGPTRPSDKHSVFYTGLGCALKISQLRTKQRLLYQMWQLVYDEAMMRMQQTFRYDYAKDPAPLPTEKPKPKKKLRQRNSLD